MTSRELLIKIKAVLEGAGLKDAAQQQRDVAKATQEATRAQEQQTRSSAQQQAAQERSVETTRKAVETTKKTATSLEEVKRASGPAVEAMGSLATAVQGGSTGFLGLIRSAKAAVTAIALGLGPAGIAAVAIGALAGLIAGLAKKFIDPQAAADRLAERIENAKKRVEDLNSQQLGSLAKQFTDAGDAIDRDVARAELLLDLEKQLLAARTGTAIAAIQASNLPDEQKKQQVAGLKLNQQLAEAQTPVRRAEIQANAAEQRLAAAKAEADKLFIVYTSQLSRLADAEEKRATIDEDLRNIRRQAASGSTEFPGQPMSPREFKESGLAAREAALLAERDKVLSDENAAAIEAQRKAFEKTQDALDETSGKLGDLEAAAKDATDALRLIKQAVGGPGKPGTIVGESFATAGFEAAGPANQPAQGGGTAPSGRGSSAPRGRIAAIVGVESGRRAQADREIAEEIKGREGKPAPNFELPPEASRPDSGFDVKAWNEQQKQRWYSGADLVEKEDKNRKTFDAQLAAAEKNASEQEKTPQNPQQADTSLGGVNKKKGGTATPGAGTIMIDGKPYVAPADTPIKEKSIAPTPLHKSVPGSIEVKDAKGQTIKIDSESIKALSSGFASELLKEIRMIS